MPSDDPPQHALLALAVPLPLPVPELVGPHRPRHDTGRGADLGRALSLALGRSYPWLVKVQRLPDAGMLWACRSGEHAEAANDAEG